MTQPKKGIDVSHWETENGGTKAHVPFNWSVFQAAGGILATIRATYMLNPLFSSWKMATDAQYVANMADAHAAPGADVVSYHLFEMRANTWQVQADYFLSVADLFGNPAMLDGELTTGAATGVDVRRWLEYVEAKTNVTPWLYANTSWIKRYFTPKDTWLRHFPLVLAAYNNTAYPAVPLPYFPSDPIGVQFAQNVYAPAYGVQNGNLGAALYEMHT